jgi:ATP-dependent Clp protease ATP-binding subunit ClpA
MRTLSRGGSKTFQGFGEMKRFLKSLPADNPDYVQEHKVYTMDDITSEVTLTPTRNSVPAVPDYAEIRREMEKHIIGQEKAVETIAYQTALHLKKLKPRKPLSIIAYGSPGTDKSEAAKLLPKILSKLCPEPYAVVWTDLNTFQDRTSVNRLVGSNPGYIGYDDTSVLESVANNPKTVFIFDETEKAHPDVIKSLMAVLDEGRCASRKELPDGSREFDFRHCIFIFTTNLRLGNVSDDKIGFTLTDEIKNIHHEDDAVDISYSEVTSTDDFDAVTKRVYRDTEAARKAFVKAGVLKEIASRFNCFAEFKPLSDEAKIKILAKQVIESGFEYDIKLCYISTDIMQALADASMSGDALTVRSFKSVIEGYLAEPFSEAGAKYAGRAVRLEGTIESPIIVPD